MIKRLVFFVLLISFAIPAQAQRKNRVGSGKTLGGFFFRKSRKEAKYFVALSYGLGQAHWKSQLGQAEIFDKFGSVIKSGDLDFKAQNDLNSFSLDASAPFGKIRLGIGIQFDYYFLDKLEITTPFATNIILYDESFRWDKFFVSAEIPFKYESDKSYSFSSKTHLGYFGYSYVDRFSLFGEEALAKTFWMATGIVADIKLYPHCYVFIFPNVEYKFYNNNKDEQPKNIVHKIFSYSCMAGIRIDVSKE
jgi:hypothetical protein